MSLAAEQVHAGYQPGSPRQRAVSTVLSATIIIVALLIAIYQTQVAPRLEKPRNPVTFDVSDRNEDAGAKAERKQKRAEQRQKRSEQTARTPMPMQVPPVEPPQQEPPPALSFLKMSHAQMMAGDIGAMSKSSGAALADAGGPSGSRYGPGEGPGGAILYDADWFHEPTNAQLSGYLPATVPPAGWGMIACQTLEHYKVDNCQILGESPRGSGLGRAALNAAWQFQVVPPRINGKPQLGAWVRIRIEYEAKAS